MYHMSNADFQKQKVYIDQTIGNVVGYHDDVSFQFVIIKRPHQDAFRPTVKNEDEDWEEFREIKSIDDKQM